MAFTDAQWGNIGQGAMIVGDIANLFGASSVAKYNAKSQKSALKYQAEISAINARLAEISARSALDAGKHEAAQTGMQYGALKSRQRASLAANGVALGTGNAAEIQASTDILKQIDLNTIKNNAIRTAFGIRTQAVNSQAEARMFSASASGISPSSAAMTTLLTGAGSVADRWYKRGVFDTGNWDNWGSQSGEFANPHDSVWGF
jgi:hypothetical protein